MDVGLRVARLVLLLLDAVCLSLMLPALAQTRRRQRQRRKKRSHQSLFFSVIVGDWLFAAIGVIDHTVLILVAPDQPAAVMLDAIFQFTFVPMLLWMPLLCGLVLADTRAMLTVRLNAALVWMLGGVYALLWPKALKAEADERGHTKAAFVLATTLLMVCVAVGVSAAIVWARRNGGSSAGNSSNGMSEPLPTSVPAKPANQQLFRFVLLVSLLEIPLLVVSWLGLFMDMSENPRLIAETIVFIVPLFNVVQFGLRPLFHKFQKQQNAQSNGNREMPPPVDDTKATLEEISGLSDMKFLAEGASGTVYRARWIGIDVAMKLLKLPSANDSDDLYKTIIEASESAFLEEARLCATLRHPNITLFLRVGKYCGKLGIVTEFCARGSLKDVLRDYQTRGQVLDWKRKIALALHVAKGLTYLHARNPTYIHRDVKASNILVTDAWQAKLADFGISKVSNFVREIGELESARRMSAAAYPSSQRTQCESTSFVGTWRWNAPEILQDPTRCYYSRATDMYSFGMVLWEMVTNAAVPFGELRFDFEVRERVLQQQRPPIPPDSGAPDAFLDLLRQCWAQEPCERPTADRATTILTKTLHRIGGRALLFENISDSVCSSSEAGEGVSRILTSVFLTTERARSTLDTFFYGSSRNGSSRRRDVSQSSSQGFFSGQFSIMTSPPSVRSSPIGGAVDLPPSRRYEFSRDQLLPSLKESTEELARLASTELDVQAQAQAQADNQAEPQAQMAQQMVIDMDVEMKHVDLVHTNNAMANETARPSVPIVPMNASDDWSDGPLSVSVTSTPEMLSLSRASMSK